MVADIVWFGLVCLLAPAIAEYAGVRKKATRGFNWIAVAGLLFILAGAFDVVTFWTMGGLEELGSGGNVLFQIIGWIFILVGVLLAAFEAFKK